MVKTIDALLLLLMLSCYSVAVFSAEQKAAANGRGSGAAIIQIDQPGRLVSHRGVTVQYAISADVVLARQMLVIHYRLQSNDAFITLRTDVEAATGESYIELSTRKTKLPEGSAKRYQYELNVLFNSSRSGALNLKIPGLVYSEGGKDRYRFNFASQAIQVKALPPYLPPYIPMVPLQIESSFSTPWSWFNPLETGKIYYWNIKLQAEKADELSLPDIRQQLISNAQVQFLPAEISRSMDKRHDTMIQNVVYTIPFVLKKSAYVSLPELSLQHFDPQSRRLTSNKYPVPRVIVLNLYAQWLTLVILLALMVLFFWKTRFFMANAYRHGRQYYQARCLLANANTTSQLRLAMNSLAQSWGWSDNISLKQWVLNWQQHIRHDDSVKQSIDAFSRSLYGPDKDLGSVKQVRQALGSSYLRQWWLCLRAALQANSESPRPH